ncbi:MAG: GapR family DNA-binding domain-containing protein [Jhaorihella sp.]
MAEPIRNDAHILLDDYLDRYREQQEQLNDLAEQKKEVMDLRKEDRQEMKAQGFDVKALDIVAKRFIETADQRENRLELESMVELYENATNKRETE